MGLHWDVIIIMENHTKKRGIQLGIRGHSWIAKGVLVTPTPKTRISLEP